MAKKPGQKAVKRHYPPKQKKGGLPVVLSAPSPLPTPLRQLVGLVAAALRDFFHWPRGGSPLPETTPLHAAAKHGNIEELRRLLREGANPNVQDVELNTPLHCASSYGAIDLLLRAGADPNALNAHHLAPLDYAQGKCARLLFRHGARPAPPPPILTNAASS